MHCAADRFVTNYMKSRGKKAKSKAHAQQAEAAQVCVAIASEVLQSDCRTSTDTLLVLTKWSIEVWVNICFMYFWTVLSVHGSSDGQSPAKRMAEMLTISMKFDMGPMCAQNPGFRPVVGTISHVVYTMEILGVCG